jgi:hypothetical protein
LPLITLKQESLLSELHANKKEAIVLLMSAWNVMKTLPTEIPGNVFTQHKL